MRKVYFKIHFAQFFSHLFFFYFSWLNKNHTYTAYSLVCFFFFLLHNIHPSFTLQSLFRENIYYKIGKCYDDEQNNLIYTVFNVNICMSYKRCLSTCTLFVSYARFVYHNFKTKNVQVFLTSTMSYYFSSYKQQIPFSVPKKKEISVFCLHTNI